MTDKELQLKLTAEEQAFRAVNRAVYNSGRLKEACEQAAEFYSKNTASLYAKYAYAVMSGDYSEDISLPPARRKELLEDAKRLIKEVCEHRDIDRWELASGARNEYYWFHALHEEQYELGERRVAAGEKRGYYSMCVGASCMAKKCLIEKSDAAAAKTWARRAVDAFAEFEKLDPDWYNINPFYAAALAVLGDAQGALAAYKDKYRKQKAAVNEAEVAAFVAEIASLDKAARS